MIKRIPRPQGVTSMNKERRKEYITKYYVNNGMMYLNQSVTVTDFSNMLNIDVSMIVRIMSEVSGLKASIIGDDDGLNKAAGALAEMVIFWGLQDKHTAQAQLGTLLKSQGARYKPFISGEVNRALANSMTATKNIMEAFKTIIPADTLAKKSDDAVNKNGKVAYVEDVVLQIQAQNQTPLNNTDIIQALRETYLNNVPNIIAMTQEDFKPESLGAGKKLSEPSEVLIEHNHDNRREIEEGIKTE